MNDLIKQDSYREWIRDLKQKVRNSQLKAAVSVNRVLLEFYWELGAEIIEKQKQTTWGSGFLKQLSLDLMAEFPDMKGFSFRNLKYIRQWYEFYAEDSIRQQAVAQIFLIPWGHNLAIVSKCTTKDEALYYLQKTVENNWSRSVLTHQIDSKLYQRAGKAITNFSKTLPVPQSDHTRLHAHVVIELITVDFEPEYAGKLNFYIRAVDEQLRKEGDNPTIGILLCKNKDKLVVEYALSDIHKPMGVSEYQLTQALPEAFKSSLPTIEDIETEFSEGNTTEMLKEIQR